MASIRGTFCERKMKPKRAFDPRSFRWKQSGRAWLLIGCPKQHWKAKAGRCAVGTEAYALLTPAGARCAAGSRRIKKGAGLAGPSWWIPRPAGPRRCYRSKGEALRKFYLSEPNYSFIESFGLSTPAPPDDFDSINHKYGLKGKQAARNIGDALWEAMPKGRPYCLDRIDLDTLNEISMVRNDPEGRRFELPDDVQAAVHNAEQRAFYADEYRAWKAQAAEEKRRRKLERINRRMDREREQAARRAARTAKKAAARQDG